MTTLETETTQTEMTCDTHTAEAGVTLMELIAALSVIAVIIIGALALYGSATTSQASTQLVSDITAIKSATKQLFMGQGTYGAAGTNLNATLIAANKIPTTIRANGAALNHSLNGQVTVTSNGGTFTIALTNIPISTCISLLTSAQDWASVTAPGGQTLAANLPSTPANATLRCNALGPMTFVSNN